MEWSFPIEHLVRLFRKLKLIKNFHFYLHVPVNLGSYSLYVLDSSKERVVATFRHNWLTVVHNKTRAEHFLYLDSALLKVLCNISISESVETQMTVSKSISENGNDTSLFARVGDTLISSQSPVVETVQLLIRSTLAVETDSQEALDITPFKEFNNVVSTISQSPYDIDRLLVMNGYLYFVNTLYTRVARLPLKQLIPALEVLNTFEMHSVLSSLFMYDSDFIPSLGMIRFDYGMSKTDNNLSTAYFYVNTVPLVEHYGFTNAFESFKATHKTTITKLYLSGLKAKADEGTTEDTVPFLTFDKATRLHIRDLSWLINQRSNIDVAYQSENSVCKFDSLLEVETMFTLYSQLE